MGAIDRHALSETVRRAWKPQYGSTPEETLDLTRAAVIQAEAALDVLAQPCQCEVARECPYCDGRGWNSIAVHASDCDGSCRQCPVEDREQCETCGGTGEVVAEHECEFGCGPDTSGQNVGGDGYSLIPACPAHG